MKKTKILRCLSTVSLVVFCLLNITPVVTNQNKANSTRMINSYMNYKNKKEDFDYKSWNEKNETVYTVLHSLAKEIEVAKEEPVITNRFLNRYRVLATDKDNKLVFHYSDWDKDNKNIFAYVNTSVHGEKIVMSSAGNDVVDMLHAPETEEEPLVEVEDREELSDPVIESEIEEAYKKLEEIKTSLSEIERGIEEIEELPPTENTPGKLELLKQLLLLANNVTTSTVENQIIALNDGMDDEEEIPEEGPIESIQMAKLDEMVPLETSVVQTLVTSCEDNEVPVSYVLGLIDTESCFDPYVVSSSGNYGLCQLHPAYFGSGLTPEQNVETAVNHISDLYDEYGNWTMVFDSYNAGHVTGSTRYANTVLSRASKWEQEMRDAGINF